MEKTINVRPRSSSKPLLYSKTAAASLLFLCSQAFAEDVTLKFWDNQQTESGLSQYQAEAVKRFEAENPGIKVEVTTIPYPE